MHTLPTKTSLRLSGPLLIILLTTFMLGGLLAFNTIQNMSREQKIMEDFLFSEGITLIRTFEAGARTTMMQEMMGGTRPIKALIQETAKTRRIAYITIVTEDGTVAASSGDHNLTSDRELALSVFKNRQPLTAITTGNDGEPIFEITSIFQALPPENMGMMGMMGQQYQRKNPTTTMLEEGRAVIHLGLCAGEFMRARKQDFNHSLFMGGLLFLLGSCGFYFLFLYQGMRVTRSTLANIRLYNKNIIESMPDGLLTLAPDGKIVACNPRMLEFAAKKFTEMEGKLPGVLFDKWPAAASNDNTTSPPFSYTFNHENGHEIEVEISSSPLRDEEGNNNGTVYLLRDLSQIRAMEAQLARSHRLASLGRMAAAIAHEIRNPLGTLRGFAQYFGNTATDEASREYSTLMISEVDRLNESISSLLQFSRSREPECTPVKLIDLFAKAHRLLQYDFQEKNISLQSKTSYAGAIFADGDLLLQVILNLLKNAIQASPTESTVTIRSSQEGDTVRIMVRDNGKGMSIEEQEQMFDPFFTTRKSGTGLGLAVSYQIIEQHHGFFEVESRQDTGTSITIVLPENAP